MHRLVAAGAPAGAALQASRMVFATDHDLALARDFEVAAQTEIIISRDQHLRVNRAVRIMTGGAAFTHRVVLKNKGAFLLGVAGRTGLVRGREINSAALDRVAFVWIMAIGARDLAGQHRVRMREVHLAAFVQVALKTGFRRLIRVHDRSAGATRFHVNATRPVAGFATGVAHLWPREGKPAMGRGSKVRRFLLMALHALFCPNKNRSRDGWRGELRSIHHHARDEQ